MTTTSTTTTTTTTTTTNNNPPNNDNVTDDGRVIKAVNKGSSSQIETVVIEDMRVFDSHDPVTDLKVFRDKAKGVEKLIVVSRENVVSLPLHRCHVRTTCRSVRCCGGQ